MALKSAPRHKNKRSCPFISSYWFLFKLGLIVSAGRLSPSCVQSGSVDPLLHQHKELLGHSVLMQVDRDPVLICVSKVKFWLGPAADLWIILRKWRVCLCGGICCSKMWLRFFAWWSSYHQNTARMLLFVVFLLVICDCFRMNHLAKLLTLSSTSVCFSNCMEMLSWFGTVQRLHACFLKPQIIWLICVK